VVVLAFVQVYNIAGSYVVLVPSLFYGVLVKGTSGCGELPGAVLSSIRFLVVAWLAKATMGLVVDATALAWRDALTRRFQQEYCRNANVYYLLRLRPDVDNPDQRITQEAREFTSILAVLLCTLGQALFAILWYSFQTWRITGWRGPVMMHVFSLTAALVSKSAASPIAGLAARADAAEGDFRRQHVQLLTSIEQVAQSGFATAEASLLDGSFGAVLALRWAIVVRSFLLSLITCFFDYAGSIANYLVVGISMCSGAYSDATPEQLVRILSQGSGFAISIAAGYSQIVDCAGQASVLAGQAGRLADLWRSLAEVRAEIQAQFHFEQTRGQRVLTDTSRAHAPAPAPPLIECTGLSVTVPGLGRELLRDVSFAVPRNSSLFIKGPSGCGKSSLLRVLRGLWPITAGTVRSVPVLSDTTAGASCATCLFVPSETYFLFGATLRQQLAYPLSVAVGDEAALGAIGAVGLGAELGRLGGLDEPRSDWSTRLSLGQRQRLAIARLFVHRPTLAILDEATSGVGVVAEGDLYQKLKLLGMSIITLGHLPSLDALHDRVLCISGHHV